MIFNKSILRGFLVGFGIVLLAALFLSPQQARSDQVPNALSRPAGLYYAVSYNWHGLSESNITGTGTQTYTLGPARISLPDGRQFNPFGPSSNQLVPVTFDMGANQETITPTAVSSVSCPLNGDFPPDAQCVNFTGSFANAHGLHAAIASGSFGLQEAILDANAAGGGSVVVDGAWSALGGASSTITGVVLATPKVWVIDKRSGEGTIYGKSGTGAAAYSASNNDISFQVTMVAGTVTKTLSQTYSVAPQCSGGGSGTLTGVLKIAPTTSTVVASSSVGTDTAVVNVHCDIAK